MSVEEYLRVLNGIFDNSELTPDNITMSGYIDIIPEIDSYAMSEAKISINSGNIIANRVFTTKDGDIQLEKTTPLSDNISIHCTGNSTSEQTIERTITALEELQQQELELSKKTNRPLVDYQSRIDAFTSILKNMVESNSELTPGSVRK